MMESINVVVDDQQNDVTDDVETSLNDAPADLPYKNNESEPPQVEPEAEKINKGPSIRIQKDHPKDLIIGDPNKGVTTRSREVISHGYFVSKIEPRNVKEALTDEFWINAMQEELGQFKRNEVWELVLRPEGINVIGTKWIYKNKSDEQGVVTKNKARLVAQGYIQV